ncbi:M60 family metallopeptidase [Aestuariibaculum marinum]|uniref:Peptidase M60 domain-containing protein n=1 Tax=Aestuariibaculum marinum TaxID=2683592 RepID=A0A8J6Q707_9FLAO|nr:M60 family metallopeptidase [Aestuariibaculum marinum]MBD0825399.1 hypothetical protein [Aestuariibaculum marinum]
MKFKNFNKSLVWIYALLMVFIVSFQSCEDDKIVEEQEGWLRVLPLDLNFDSKGGTKDIYLVLTGNVNSEEVSYDIAANGKDWCSVVLEGEYLHVTTMPNYIEAPRNTVITLDYGIYSRKVPVSQEQAVGDQLIGIVSAKATSEETEIENRGLEFSYDSDYETYFNSKFGAISEWPFQIEYTLESGYTLNRIIYHPRTDAGNKWGAFNEYEVWVSTEAAPETFTKVGEYSRGDANFNVTVMKFETPLENIAKVRFDVYSSYQNRISCAEMEFYQDGTTNYDYSGIFVDDMYSVLKEGVSEAELKAIPDDQLRNLALDLFVGEYSSEFRAASYRPYQNPSVQSAINKTSTYSKRDNPTGIYVEEGEELLVIVGDTKGQNITIDVQDLNVGFGSAKSYPLLEGENRLMMENSGLVYVQNITNDNIPLILETDEDKELAQAKTVNIHFVNAKVNGYFDLAKHNVEDWTRILGNAVYQDLDVMGLRSHITWTTENFKSYNTDIVTVLEKYDRLVYLEEEFAGLEKYEKMFNNRMYFHIDYNGASPYATSYRTAYTSSYAEIFCNASRFEARLWGPAHEAGHVNQLRPGLKWAGTTEVTNNLMSLYVQTEFGEPCKLLVDGTYSVAKNNIIAGNTPHATSDFLSKLVPFWQLKLYMVDALGKTDFYRDIYEHYRVTPNLTTNTTTQGILQLDFVRQVCRISGLNMLDFFQKWGFLTPVDTTLNDYGNKAFKITQAQIDALKIEINAAGYNMPHDNVEDIQDDNISAYN